MNIHGENHDRQNIEVIFQTHTVPVFVAFGAKTKRERAARSAPKSGPTHLQASKVSFFFFFTETEI